MQRRLSPSTSHCDPSALNESITDEIIRYCPNSNQILLMGDFNSCSGLCFVGECISDQHGLESLADESQEICNNFIKNNIPLKRQNAEKTTNCYGNKMIEFCKILKMQNQTVMHQKTIYMHFSKTQTGHLQRIKNHLLRT